MTTVKHIERKEKRKVSILRPNSFHNPSGKYVVIMSYYSPEIGDLMVTANSRAEAVSAFAEKYANVKFYFPN